MSGQEDVHSEEYLFENSRPHLCWKGHAPCSLSGHLLVLALSSHVPSDQSDMLETTAEARRDPELSLVFLLLIQEKAGKFPSSQVEHDAS